MVKTIGLGKTVTTSEGQLTILKGIDLEIKTSETVAVVGASGSGKTTFSRYFINQYYKPNISYSLVQSIRKIATSSIDISDGLIADLEKLINTKKNSYKLFFESIPISKNLNSVINLKKLLKKNLISRGDDYQILFTSNIKNRMIIKKIALKKKIKITRIGKILNNSQKSSIIDRNGLKIKINTKGYLHRFD